MSKRMNFAITLNDLDNNLSKSRGECFDYGSCWGCDRDCPVFQRGECELQKENEEQLEYEFWLEQERLRREEELMEKIQMEESYYEE